MKRYRPTGSQSESREKPSAHAKALGLLVRRERSQRELKTRLTHEGYSDDESSAAIEALQKDNHLSNTRFAEMLARTRCSAGYGPLRISAELRSHGISDAEIRSAIDGLECDWHELAQHQLRRHFGNASANDPKSRASQSAFLSRRGFDAAAIKNALRANANDSGVETG